VAHDGRPARSEQPRDDRSRRTPDPVLHAEQPGAQAEAVRQAIIDKQKEHILMPWDESIINAEVNDEIRRQIGVKYPQDDRK